MTNDFEDFHGAVWRIFCYTKADLTEEEKQKFLDLHINNLSVIFKSPSGLSTEKYSEMYISQFQKMHNEAKERIEKILKW